jgi:hypothetical protein
MVTGEAWNAIMYECMVTEDCDSSIDCARGTCCGLPGAPLYFITFVILGSFVILNLLIAVVLDNFANNKKEEGVTVTDDNIDDFAVAWSKVDPRATGFIPITKVATLLKLTPPPLGVKGSKISRLGLLRFQKNLNLKVDSNYLHYQEMLQAVTSRAMGIDFDQLPIQVQTVLEVGKVRKRLTAAKKLKQQRVSGSNVGDSDDLHVEITHGIAGLDGEELDLAQLCAVERIQAVFRGKLARRRAKEAAEAALEQRARAKAEIVLGHVQELMRSVEVEQARRRRGAGGRAAGDSAGESERESEDKDSAMD